MAEAKDDDGKIRRVLFEVSVDSTGAIDFWIDQGLRPVTMLGVIGALDLAKKSLMTVAADCLRGDDDE